MIKDILKKYNKKLNFSRLLKLKKHNKKNNVFKSKENNKIKFKDIITAQKNSILKFVNKKEDEDKTISLVIENMIKEKYQTELYFN